MESEEIYPNAPLWLVAFELRFPLAMKLASRATLTGFQEALEDELPSVELGLESAVSFDPKQGFQELPSRPLFKLYSRNRRTAVTLAHTSLVVETSQYVRYALFRALVQRALHALEGAGRVPGIARVGLRYVNEVRAPGVLAAGDWHGWIDSHLMGPTKFCKLPVAEYQTRLQFELGEGHGLQMNAGTLHGEFVSSTGELRVPPRTGPFFLIDIDSYNSFEDLEDFDVATAMDMCDRLRQPVRKVFEGAITARLRDEVLRVLPDVESKETQEVRIDGAK